MTEAERYIAAHYEEEDTVSIAAHLGLSEVKVRSLAHKVGVGKKRDDRARCRGCQMYVNGTCIVLLSKCRAARTTRPKWPAQITITDFI